MGGRSNTFKGGSGESLPVSPSDYGERMSKSRCQSDLLASRLMTHKNGSAMENIVIIDDDPAIQMLLKRTLASRGYEVTVAGNGADGLAQVQALHPAMVICDWVMPKMNGLEVCRHVKSLPELATTFFILLTSKGSVEDRVEGLDAGADDFLCKPIEMFELEARIRSGLRLYQLNNDLKRQKQLIEAELAEAADYVCSLLPEPSPYPPLIVDMRFIPSSQLGGDSFDYYWLDDQYAVMYLLDVSGHGLRAALPSVSVLNLLRSQALKQVDYRKPSQVLAGLNEIFQMTARNDKYFTIWYGVYNQRKRQLTYASAGHPPAILISPQRGGAIATFPLKTPGFPVGMFPGVEYEEAVCTVAAQSSLYLFSDGIYEIPQHNGEIWGIDPFIAQLETYHRQRERNLDDIIQVVRTLARKPDFDDDLSLLEIRFAH